MSLLTNQLCTQSLLAGPGRISWFLPLANLTPNPSLTQTMLSIEESARLKPCC